MGYSLSWNWKRTAKLEEIAVLIYEGGCKPWKGQFCKDFDDINHPGEKVGKWVYCSQYIKKI